jgi:hypothetical protein
MQEGEELETRDVQEEVFAPVPVPVLKNLRKYLMCGIVVAEDPVES